MRISGHDGDGHWAIRLSEGYRGSTASHLEWQMRTINLAGPATLCCMEF
jgi:hypothetical protein